MGGAISFYEKHFLDPDANAGIEAKVQEALALGKAREYKPDLWPTPAASRTEVGDSSCDDTILRSYAEVMNLSMRLPWECIIPHDKKEARRFIRRFRAHIPDSVAHNRMYTG